jgi:putative ABC transport system permease protein
MLFRLTAANLTTRRLRTLLTVMAIAFSVALVVAMTSGFAAFENAADSFMGRYAGVVDAKIGRTTDITRGIDRMVVTELEADPRVRRAWGRLDTDAPLPQAPGVNSGLTTPRAALVGVERAKDPLLDWLKLNEGRWFEPGEDAVVIDHNLAERQQVKPGGKLKLRGQHGEIELPVVGVVHMTGAFGALTQSKIYAPLPIVQRFVYGDRAPDVFTSLSVQLAPAVDVPAFADAWTQRLAAVDPLLKFKLTRTTREEVDKNLAGLRLLSTLGGEVALLTAAFIIFSTLSMGVSERQRVLATLRAIGMNKWQVATTVVGEAALLATAGILIGVPLGYAGATVLVKFLSQRFSISPALDWPGVLIAGGSALLAAVAASLMPAWQATRVDPLEAMTPLADSGRDRLPRLATVVGLLLIAIDPLLFTLPYDGPYSREIRFYGHFVLGLPALMIGFFLIAPALVLLLTQTLGRLISLAMRVPFAVMRQQTSDSNWRAAGTSAALMVGLATLVVMQTQGHSSLKSWTLPTNFPDVFVYTQSISGLTPESQEAIRRSPLIKPEDFMPIGALNPEVGPGVLGLIQGIALPGSTMYVAVEPDRAFRLMELDFRQGNPEEAAKLLASGRHVVVTEEFHKVRGVGVGDTITFKSRTAGMLEYKIAGVVWSPGIDVMISTFDVGQQFEQQSQACVFGSLENARNDFGLRNVFMVCANLKQLGLPREKVTEQLQAELNDKGLRVADVRQLKHMIESGLQHLLNAASIVAWSALAVASLGVANAIAAGVRTRMWQFGILRSIGLSRATLLRVVLVEAILLGCIGAAMGLLCGSVMVFDSRHLLAMTIGHEPPLSVPWRVIGIGAGAVIAVSVLASLTSALGVARREPLSLLQAGRAAA